MEELTEDTSIDVENEETKSILSSWRLAAISFFWCTYQIDVTALYMILFPLQTEVLTSPESKGLALGVLLLVGAIGSFGSPIFGFVSDRSTSKYGKRRPFVVFGATATIIGILLMWLSNTIQSFPLFVFSWFITSISLNISSSPYQAIIPDIVHPSQLGVASGWMGLMNVIGSCIGGSVGYVFSSIGFGGCYLFIILITIAGAALTVVMVSERPGTPPAINPAKRTIKELFFFVLSTLVEPFRASYGFFWAFWSRLVSGMTIFQSFLQYWFLDAFPQPYDFFSLEVAKSAEEATSFFILVLLGGSVCFSLLAGKLADIYGPKPVLYISGFFLSSTIVIISFFHPYTFVICMGIIHGFGYGGYISVIFAIMTSTLPSKNTFGKDLGIWSCAETMPQIFAPIIAGGILDFLQEKSKDSSVPDLGYKVIWWMAAFLMAISMLLVRKIRPGVPTTTQKAEVQSLLEEEEEEKEK